MPPRGSSFEAEAEAQRVRALRATGLLDSSPEHAYDELVELAAAICEVPISAISLIDEDRLWFKARIGLPVQEISRDGSFCARTIQQDGLMEVPDSLDDPRFADNPPAIGDRPIRFYGGVPLHAGSGAKIGTLCVLDFVPRRLTSLQRRALQVLAGQVSAQVELRMRVMELELLTERACSLTASKASEGRFRAFLDDSPAGTFIQDSAGCMLYCNRAMTQPYGAEPDDWIGRTVHQFLPDEYANRWCEADLAVQREARALDFYEESPRAGQSPLYWNMFKFLFTDMTGGRYLACIARDITREREIEDELFRYQAELQSVNLQLADLSVTDALTQISNRRAFDDILAREFEISRRSRSPLSLMILDVDNFKSFNDTFGHVNGDAVLRQIASLLDKNVRVPETVARYGGEEFAVILPRASEADAVRRANSLCALVAQADWDLRPMTVSIGVACLPDEIHDIAEFTEYTDKSLYTAKHSGKNQVQAPNGSQAPSPTDAN